MHLQQRRVGHQHDDLTICVRRVILPCWIYHSSMGLVPVMASVATSCAGVKLSRCIGARGASICVPQLSPSPSPWPSKGEGLGEGCAGAEAQLEEGGLTVWIERGQFTAHGLIRTPTLQLRLWQLQLSRQWISTCGTWPPQPHVSRLRCNSRDVGSCGEAHGIRLFTRPSITALIDVTSLRLKFHS